MRPALIIALFLLLFTMDLCLLVSSETKSEVIHFSIDGQIPEQIDPQSQQIINQKLLQHALFATLFRFETESPPRPFLAKNVSINGKTALIELHPGLRFSDGSPITTREVISSLERLLKTPQPQNLLQQYIDGADLFVAKESPHCPGLVQVDDLHFQIKYKLQFLTLIHLLSEAVTAILPQNWQPGQMVFSGPYCLENRVQMKGHETIFLKKNPYWNLTQPSYKRIEFSFHRDPASFFEAIKSGEPDYFFITFGNEFPLVDVPYRIIKIPTNGQFYLLLNPRIKPLDDIAWRVFFKEIILDLSKRMQTNWRGAIHSRLVLPYGLPGYDLFKPLKPGEIIRPKSPAAMLTLPINLNRTALRVKLYSFLNEKLAPYQVQLKPIWEHISQTMPRIKTGDFTMTGFYHLCENPITINFFERLFIPYQELNPGGFCLNEAIELINRYHLEEQDLERVRILAKLESLAQESAFLIPVMGLSYTFGSRLGRQPIQSNRFLNLYLDQFKTIHER